MKLWEDFAAACGPKHVRFSSAHEHPTCLGAALAGAVQYRGHQCALQLADRMRSIEMLKSQGMSNRAIAHRLGVSETAIRKLVGPSKPAESAQLALPAIPTAAEKPTTTGVPAATSSGEGRDRATRSAEESIGDGDPVAAPEAANDDEPVPMSLDGDAEDRTLDRQLAYLGLLDDAAPLFREGSSVPGVGVLLALPCLVESGLFRICRKLYGEIGPAFYGLRTTLLTLLLMALLRMKRPEHLKEKDPAAFGRLLGSPCA